MSFTLTETCDLIKLESVCNNPYIIKEDIPQLIEYYKELKSNGSITVDYKQKTIGGISMGRFYPEANGRKLATYMWGAVRSELFKDINYDIDLENCHPTLLLNICKDNGFPCKHLSRYVANRDDFIEDLNILDSDVADYNKNTHSNVSKKDIAKQFFTSKLYCGSNNSVKDAYGLSEPIIKKRAGDAISLIKELEKTIENVVNLSKYQKLVLALRKEKKKCHDGTIMSYILQDEEAIIIYDAIKFFTDNNCKPTAYIYDGFQVPKLLDLSAVPTLLKQFNDKHDNKFKLIIKAFKTPLSQLHYDTPIRTPQQIDDDWKLYNSKSLKDVIKGGMCLIPEEEIKIDNDKTYNRLKIKFESEITKIINKKMFIKKTSDGFVFFNRSELLAMYENLWFDDLKTRIDSKSGESETEIKSYPFVKKWLTDEFQSTKFDLGVYPNDKLCPSDIYNMWIPFAMDNNDPYIDNPDALNIFRKHVQIICNHDEKVISYMENWIAHLFQCPEEKSICPVLISQKEGTGKTLFVEILGAICGSKKLLITTDPARDVWGQFNGQMSHAYIVNPNEISKKDSVEYMGKIKGLITDRKLTINEKGKGQYEIYFYGRCIITTNQQDPIASTEGDRRFLIINCSAEMKGNVDYFDKLGSILDDTNSLKTIFKYYTNVDNFDAKKFKEISMPVTEYQQIIKESNISIEEQFIEQLVADLYDNSISNQIEEISSSDCFQKFQKFLKKSGFDTYQTNIIKLGRTLGLNEKYSSYITKKRTNKGNNKLFDITSMAQIMGIDKLPNEDVNTLECLIP